MRIDGIDTEEYLLCNLGGGQAFGAEADDLDFPLGEAYVGNLAAAPEKYVLHIIRNIGIDRVGSRYDFFTALPDLVGRER